MKKYKKAKKTAVGTDSGIHGRIFEKIMKDRRAVEAYQAEDIMFKFVEQIKREMERKHLTNYSVAKRADLDHQVLARILNGSKNAEIATLAKIAGGIGAKLELVLHK